MCVCVCVKWFVDFPLPLVHLQIGGTYTHPVVMTPQVAIGGLGQTRVLPRFDADGRVVPAHIMVVSWTADHRIIDGVTMASFSNLWKQYLENPNLLMLGAK